MQFSLFGAAVAPPTLADLDGVLLGGGQWVRANGAARLSVVVSAPWRAAALCAAFAERGVAEPEDPIVPAEGGLAARTGFSATLNPSAAAWIRGANQGPPAGFTLTPGGLRLWAIASGRPDESGYLLATTEPDDAVHRIGGAQLAALGLTAVALTVRGGGPGWRITSTKRLRRLAELLGEPPSGAGSQWPAG